MAPTRRALTSRRALPHRSPRGMQFEWGCNCLLFYVSTVYVLVHAALMVLRLGPFAVRKKEGLAWRAGAFSSRLC